MVNLRATLVLTDCGLNERDPVERVFHVEVGFDRENDIYLVDASDIPGLTGWDRSYRALVHKIAATSMELLNANRKFIKPIVQPEENLGVAIIQVLDTRNSHITHRFPAGSGLSGPSAG
jgi:hypothetical protein